MKLKGMETNTKNLTIECHDVIGIISEVTESLFMSGHTTRVEVSGYGVQCRKMCVHEDHGLAMVDNLFLSALSLHVRQMDSIISHLQLIRQIITHVIRNQNKKVIHVAYDSSNISSDGDSLILNSSKGFKK